MPKIKVNKSRCKGCHLCIAFCMKKNLKLDTKFSDAGILPVVVVDENNCLGCGFCFQVCPDMCIEIEG